MVNTKQSNSDGNHTTQKSHLLMVMYQIANHYKTFHTQLIMLVQIYTHHRPITIMYPI